MSGYVPNIPKGYRNMGGEPVDIHAQRWTEYPDLPPKANVKPDTKGCVFAKSCNLPDGVINHNNSAGFVSVEKLADYGLRVVLGTGAAITAQGIQLQMVSGSATGSVIAERLGGSLVLTLLGGPELSRQVLLWVYCTTNTEHQHFARRCLLQERAIRNA